MKKRIILGSASPRRSELLAQIGVEFEVRVSEKEEIYKQYTGRDCKRTFAYESGKRGV